MAHDAAASSPYSCHSIPTNACWTARAASAQHFVVRRRELCRDGCGWRGKYHTRRHCMCEVLRAFDTHGVWRNPSPLKAKGGQPRLIARITPKAMSLALRSRCRKCRTGRVDQASLYGSWLSEALQYLFDLEEPMGLVLEIT